MSDPYVYTPRVTYRNSPYLAPYYTQQNSPFIPPMTLNPSPFSPNVALPSEPTVMMASPQPSPFVPAIPFPSASPLDDDDYLDPHPHMRPRTTSWTGGMVPANIQNTAWLNPRRPHRSRSRSDAGYFDQPPQVVNINNGYWLSPSGSPYNPYSQLPPAAPQVPHLSLHPYLDGHNPRGDIVFDLMAPYFAPMRLVGNNQTILITNEELGQVASHPPIYNVKIVNDHLPSWPIDLSWNPSNRYSAVAPPLKLGDILSAIYNALHMCISQTYWASLSPAQVYVASRAYTARCRAMGPMEQAVALQGVKRIDFLNGQRIFKGLVRTSDPNVLKFNVA